MSTWPLYSARFSHMHEPTLFALLRITQLLVKSAAKSLCVVPVVRAAADPADQNTVRFWCELNVGHITGLPLSYSATQTNLSVLHALQHLLTAAANDIGWENHVLIPPPGRPKFPSILHSVCRNRIRSLSSACYYGIEVTLSDNHGSVRQRLSIGKPLGTEWTADRMVVPGKVADFTETANHEVVVRLVTTGARLKTMLLSSHLNVEAMLEKMVAAQIEPVRGRILHRIVAWSAPHWELF